MLFEQKRSKIRCHAYEKQWDTAHNRVEASERKSRESDLPGPRALCQDPASQACIVGALDGISTISAGVATVCAPCAIPAGGVSLLAGGIGAGITFHNVLYSGAPERDLIVTTVTLTIGAKSIPSVGLLASAFQWWYDFHPE